MIFIIYSYGFREMNSVLNCIKWTLNMIKELNSENIVFIIVSLKMITVKAAELKNDCYGS
jgi:hypothetical protein